MDSKRAESKKIQFEFSSEAYKRLEALEELTDATTKAEVIRKALKVYEWLVTQLDPSNVIEVKDQAGNDIYKIPVGTLR